MAESDQFRFDRPQDRTGVLGVDMAHVADAKYFPFPGGAAAVLASRNLYAVLLELRVSEGRIFNPGRIERPCYGIAGRRTDKLEAHGG